MKDGLWGQLQAAIEACQLVLPHPEDLELLLHPMPSLTGPRGPLAVAPQPCQHLPQLAAEEAPKLPDSGTVCRCACGKLKLTGVILTPPSP